MRVVRFEFQRKTERVNMRLPRPLLDAVKASAARRECRISGSSARRSKTPCNPARGHDGTGPAIGLISRVYLSSCEGDPLGGAPPPKDWRDRSPGLRGVSRMAFMRRWTARARRASRRGQPVIIPTHLSRRRTHGRTSRTVDDDTIKMINIWYFYHSIGKEG